MCVSRSHLANFAVNCPALDRVPVPVIAIQGRTLHYVKKNSEVWGPKSLNIFIWGVYKLLRHHEKSIKKPYQFKYYPKVPEFIVGDTNMLVSENAKPLTPNLKCVSPPTPNPKICVIPDANPRRQSMEYRWHWIPNATFRVGHVHFMLFMSISFASGTQRKPSF